MTPLASWALVLYAAFTIYVLAHAVYAATRRER